MTGESDIDDGIEIYNWWLESWQGVSIGPPHTISAKIAIRDKTALHIAAEAGHIYAYNGGVGELKKLAQASLFVVELNFPEFV